tara:strand:+ start:820 stop:2463 length:1644 start_codon:yes stop_codon:yes gene_type:complete
MPTEVVTLKEAFGLLSTGIKNSDKVAIGTFWEFVRDVWSLSFERPELFKAWHVKFLCEELEATINDNSNYAAILPRAHFKSTILGHAFALWLLLRAKTDTRILYLSYSDTMAKYHMSEINKEVSRNPKISKWIRNEAPKADYTFRYRHANGSSLEIEHGGLFSFKRGMHVNGALIADDILKDPENPLNLSQINKIEDHFMTESMFIPNQGVPVVVMGTPMLPGDILAKLETDTRFKHRKLPAFDPVPGRRVLMPELYSEEWLLEQQKAKPKSFASEFLLQPFLSQESYFSEEDIAKTLDYTLRSYPANHKHEFPEGDRIYAGFDVGKKRHPSHLVIFRKSGDKIEQIHQTWLDGWDYTAQIAFLNEVAENFNLTKGYIDNTRGELEDRGLDAKWWPMHFTVKSKMTMAQIFETYVHEGNTKLLADERQTSQILSVNNELKAPETPMGHGDAFFSIAMALQACYESSRYQVQTVGNMQELLEDLETAVNDAEKTPAQAVQQKLLGYNDNTPGTDPAPRPLNPECDDVNCGPNVWIPERGLCLYCGFRK